ncbi:MAG: hypothetical protein CVU43_11605 [Chloroflexi bacterium HGW-Chloroflexi-5]|jgi:G:T-mismatch repair DNA endonuclease (very short patch repair protein)|nr:MAG: hypothetical protein CVU43_11605 [Chloroflexi bacterium HGW-Chloroflexi-5]
MSPEKSIACLDVSLLAYDERVCAAAVQGLLNRSGARVFLDYGTYDDPMARRTNEVFMDDDFWYGKYRAMLGNQDQNNLDYYKQEHGFAVEQVKSLDDLINQNLTTFKGYVVWDDAQPDTINLAVMLAGLDELIAVSPAREEWVKQFNLPKAHDLRGKWQNRVDIYTWAFEHLFPRCKKGMLACLEPAWERPEFLDYAVQNNIFIYSLSSTFKGFGSTALLLLAFGPPWLRELLFALRLDGLLKRLALAWMGRKSAEVKLSNRIQTAVEALPYPTIFGWHTKRDDELTFMLQLSSNGLRLVPSHLAGNFSFHSQVSPLGEFKADPIPEVKLDPQGTYVTFTLSDGDQLMMMNTAELGNWNSPARGCIPFNWETQPLLADLAPALLERFSRTKSANDCLVAGPSGAGYVVPPLAAHFSDYMRATAITCQKAGINVVTTYVADPPRRVLNQLVKYKGHLLGFLSGYAIVTRAPQELVQGTPVFANEIPQVAHIWDTASQLLSQLEGLLLKVNDKPRFIGVHLFAYRTSIDDVAAFIKKHNTGHLHFVRADEFLLLAQKHLNNSSK